MKIYINFSVLIGLLLFSSITHGQTTYKKYIRPNAPFRIDTVFNKYDQGLSNSSPANHLWLTTLSSQYIDTTKNKINPFAIPEYHEIKNRGLFGPRNVQKQMNAGLYYHPYFFRTMPYGKAPYDPIYKPYSELPYGYSSFSNKASGSPYFILPKY